MELEVMMQRLMSAIGFLLVCPIALAVCPKAVEKLESPADRTQTRSTSMYFSWSPVQAMGYDLVLIRNGIVVKAPETCSGSPYPNCGGILKPGRYEWYVRAYDQGCSEGTESKPPHFSLQIDGCDEVPAPLAPLNDARDVPARATLKWSGDTTAAYDVFYQEGSDCTTMPPTKIVTGTSADVALKANTMYAWRVRESPSQSCANPQFSACAKFTTCNPPGPFALEKPVVAGTHVTLSWTPAQGADGYVVSTTWNGADFSYPTKSTSICLRLWNSPIPYFTWSVKAMSGNCSTRSTSDDQNGKFKTDDCIPPKLVAPLSKSTKTVQPITFEWKSPQYTDACHVDPNNAAFIKRLSPPTSQRVCSSSTPGTTSCSETLPPGEYSWYVQTITETEDQGRPEICRSSEWKFTVQ